MIVEFNDVSYGYDGKAVLTGLNFKVNEGDYLCIVGENGSGKSTLIKGLLRLQPAMSGEVSFGFKKSEVGYLPQQNHHNREFPASVYEIVLSGCERSGKLFHTKEDKKKALSAMEKMNVAELADRSFRELSGGQMQKTLLARAILSTEKILILDEPVSGLDPIATEEMYALIEKINKEGVTIIMVSHNIAEAGRCASHVLHLGNKQLFFGTKEEYFRSDIMSGFFGGDEK